MTAETAIKFLYEQPAEFGRMVGFKDLTDELHGKWIKSMIKSGGDKTLQAHRGSYKTSCVSVALAIIILTRPRQNSLFIRKTDDDIKEVIRQVRNILLLEVTQVFAVAIWGEPCKLSTNSTAEIDTSLSQGIRGGSQLVGIGVKGSLTGKHFDNIFTDDIVNVKDRISRAERESTKIVYQELQNVKNRGGRIFNTGTPWHRDDCFSIMPMPEVYDCYTTGIMTAEQVENIKTKMERSLFAANYELRHIASEDVIFSNPQKTDEVEKAEQGICHIDAAYSGEDYTAFTIMNKLDGKYYVFGKLWRKHADDCIDEIQRYVDSFNAGKIYCETNGDKGYLAKELKQKGFRPSAYHENMNKFIKITTYLKALWSDIIFVAGTDEDYINQICDYNENAEHDDAPDSCSCLARIMSKKGNREEYIPLWN